MSNLFVRRVVFVVLAVSIPWNKSNGGVLDLTNGSFFRDGVSYFSEGNTMQTYPAAVPRTTTVLSCSASDGEMISGEGPNGEDIAPWCSNSNGLYGVNPGITNHLKNLYFSEDGVEWVKIYTSPYRIKSMFAATDDMLIAWMDTPSPSQTAYYSADSGLTWHPCVNTEGGDVVFAGGGLYPWNFHQRPPKEGESYGTIIASTYNGPLYPHQIWRSTDNGITWQKVLELEPYYVTHFHAVGYHAGLDKWVADTGDSSNPDPPYNNRQHTFVSDDDGQTWHEYAYNLDGTGKKSNTGQVIRFRDYGHPTRLLLASDGCLRIGWVDLVTWEVGTFMKAPPINTTRESIYFYDVFEYDNLWYACFWSYGTTYHHAVIYVSPDLEHWAIYHRFSDTSVQGGNHFAGFAGGKLHIKTSTDTLSVLGHFSISPAEVCLVNNALVLTPPKTNEMTETQSKCESISGWSTNLYNKPETIFTTVWDTNFAGSQSIYFKHPDPGKNICLYSPIVNVVPGQTYIPRFWIKGSSLPYCIIGIADSNKSLLMNQYFPLLDNQWTEVWGTPYTVPWNMTSLRLISILCRSQVNPQVEGWLGATELASVPAAPWHVGESTSAQEALNHSANLGIGFTHVFFTELIPSTSDMGDDPLYLYTYYISPNEYVELFYDVILGAFTLQSTTSDPNLISSISSGPRWFQRSAAVKVAVRYLNGVMSLSIADGDGTEHVSDTLTRQGVPLHGVSRIIGTGDHNGDAVMPQKLYDNYLFNRALSNQEIESIFNVTRISDANISDVNDLIAPEAFIDSIVPSPATRGETVTFTGHGTDADGSVVTYSWDSNRDGHLCDAASFSTMLLSTGEHIITFTVTDNDGLTSTGVTQQLVINIPGLSKFNLDGDPLGNINFNDLVIFVDNWLAEGFIIEGDFNDDGKVDFFDFALLSTYWLMNVHD